MQNIYTDGTYYKNNPTWDEEDTAWKANQINILMKNNFIQPDNVCEVGCGSGKILSFLQQRLNKNIIYYGFDISPQAIDKCQEIANDNLHFMNTDLLQYDEKTFDVVMAIDVIEHVDDYIGFLKQLRRYGNHYIFHIPLDLSIQNVLRVSPIQQVRHQVGHLHYFTKETAIATLEYCGYEIQDSSYTKWSLELPPTSPMSRLWYWPRKIVFWFNEDLAVRLFGGFSLIVLAK